MAHSTDCPRVYSFTTYFLIGIVLCFFTILVYHSSLFYPFLFDDKPNILAFFDIRHKKFLDLCMQSSRWISTWLNTMYYAVGRFNPLVYRAGNIVIHITNGMLIYALLLLLFNKRKYYSSHDFISCYAQYIALLTAGLFLLHPVQTQTVCYIIQGQLEGLALLSILLTVLFFYLVVTTPKKTSQLLAFVALLTTAVLSAGTKEIAIVGPLLVLLVDWFFIAHGSWRVLKKRWYIYALLVAVVLISFCYTLRPEFFWQLITLKLERCHTIGNIVGQTHEAAITPFTFFISQLPVIVHYMWIFVWPFGISVDYDMQLAKSFWTVPTVLAAGVLLLLFAFIAIRLYRKSTDLVAASLLWFFIALLPRATIFPSSELIVDYKTYPASPGLLALFAGLYVAALVGLLNSKMLSRWSSRLWLFLGLILSFYGLASYKRTHVWRDGLAFWADIIQKAPNKARAYNNYAVALIENDRHTEALDYAKKAIKLDSIYADPWNNLAIAYAKMNQLDLAISSLQNALAIMPNHPEGYNNLAAFLLAQERYREANDALEQALKLRPHYGNALMNQGRMFTILGRIPEAYESFKKCCTAADLDNKAIGFASWGMTSAQLGLWDDAITGYKRALELEPQNLEYRQQLAQAYLISKNYPQAFILLKELYTKNSDDLPTALSYAESLLKLAYYADALSVYRKIYTRISCFSFPVTYLRMAACYYKLNQFPAAQQQIEVFLSCNPPAALKALAQDMAQALKTDSSDLKQAWDWILA